MHRRVLLTGVLMLVTAFGASSRPVHFGGTTTLTLSRFCPELPPDCCRYSVINGCRVCVQTGC